MLGMVFAPLQGLMKIYMYWFRINTKNSSIQVLETIFKDRRWQIGRIVEFNQQFRTVRDLPSPTVQDFWLKFRPIPQERVVRLFKLKEIYDKESNFQSAGHPDPA